MKKLVIGFYFHPELRYFHIALARFLCECGGEVHGYCATDQEVAFYQREVGDALASLTNIEKPFRFPPAITDRTRLIRDARVWEERLDCTFNLLAVANRHFGRGYALGGPGHPRSRMSEEIDLDGMLSAYVAYADAWNAEFQQRKFDLIVNAPSLAARLARSLKIPYRVMIGSRTENLHFWAHDEFFWSPVIEEAYAARINKRYDTVSLDKPYLTELAHRARFVRSASFAKLLLNLAKMTVMRVYHHLRGYEKARGYRLIDNLLVTIRTWRDTNLMTGPSMLKLADIKDELFVFFPLHTEPESSVGQASPEFFFQHTAIAALSRDLPAGVKLVVKETIHSVGRRPRDFYRQVADLKNVVWIDMMEYGLDVVRHSAAVATITGTAGMEAAVMGKPVIVFGRHCLYSILPHVYSVIDIGNLREALGAALNSDFDTARARQDGARYLDAVKATSFDMGEYDYVHYASFDHAAVVDAADALMQSLPSTVSSQDTRVA